MRQTSVVPKQSTMFDVFDRAERNARTAHLPSNMHAAILYFRDILQHYHAAILAWEIDGARRTNKEAHDLAANLNGGSRFGILAEDNSPGSVLERETRAPKGVVPLYGQLGEFIIEIGGVQIRIEMHGIFHGGSCSLILPGFEAHAVDYSKPFISGTGYRNFPVCPVKYAPGTPPDELVRQVLSCHIVDKQHGLNGKLVPIQKEHIPRAQSAVGS